MMSNNDGDRCKFKSNRSKSSHDRTKHICRIEYLIKASELFSDVDPNVSRIYNKELKDIATKHLIRLNKTLKKKICFGCNTLLTTDSKIVNVVDDWISTTCIVCTRTRRVKHTDT